MTMNPVIPLFLAQTTPDDHGNWLSIVIIAVFVALIAVYALMRRSRNPRSDRNDPEIPPGDPLAAARKDEAEYAIAHVRASDQTR